MINQFLLALAFVALLTVPTAAQDHANIVLQVYGENPPAKTVEGALEFTLRVVARINQQFPNERVGLLEKVAGENIAPHAGTFVSAARICYPNQRHFKVLTDVPTTNGPSWQDEGYVSVGGYMRGYLAVALPLPPVEKPPIIVLPSVDLSGILNQQAVDHAILLELQRELAAARKDIAEFREAVKSKWAAVMNSPFVKYGLAAVAGWLATSRLGGEKQ